jgi:HK97 family phage portal protein
LSILDTLRSLTRSAPAAKEEGFVERLQPWSTPPRRGSVELLLSYRTMPWLRIVTSRISDSCASVTLEVRRRLANGEFSDPLLEHPLAKLLSKPNPALTQRSMRKLTQLHLDMMGEGLWIKERSASGEVVMLVPLPPAWILETPTPDRPFFRLSHNQVQRTIPARDVVYIRDVDPYEPYGRGVGLAMSLADELDTDEYAAKYMKAYFYNSARPEMIVTVEGAEKSELAGYKENWDSNHRGFWGAFRTLFTGRQLKVERLDTAFRDMQLVELRDSQRDRIVSVFGVPPEIFGILTNSNRSTIDAADELMSRYVVIPRMDLLCDSLNAQLAPEFGPDIVVTYVSPARDDREFQRSVVATRPSAFTDNEVRTLAGLELAKGKDEYPSASPFGALGGDPEWTRSLPPRHKRNAATYADAQRALEALRPERLTVRTDPVMLAGVESWSKSVLADLGAEAKFDLLNPLLPKYVEAEAAKRITGDVNETTRKSIRESLLEGVEAGESVDDLAVRIEDVFDEADTARAETIARTEVVGASNWATREAQRVSGVVEKRAWVSTRDGRARESHLDLDGKEAGLDEPFRFPSGDNEGKPVEYPGGSGIAGEDINCRCTTVAVISDDFEETDRAIHAANVTTERLDAVFRAYDRALVPWERDMRAALRGGFAAQQRDVLRALRKP